MTLTFNLFMDLCNYHAPLHYISWLCDKILLEEEELTGHLLFLKSYNTSLSSPPYAEGLNCKKLYKQLLEELDNLGLFTAAAISCLLSLVTCRCCKGASV